MKLEDIRLCVNCGEVFEIGFKPKGLVTKERSRGETACPCCTSTQYIMLHRKPLSEIIKERYGGGSRCLETKMALATQPRR